MLNAVLCLLGNLPASELLVPTFRNLLAVPFSYALNAYEDGTASKFRNIGNESSDAGRLPKRHITAYSQFVNVKSGVYELTQRFRGVNGNKTRLHMAASISLW